MISGLQVHAKKKGYPFYLTIHHFEIKKGDTVVLLYSDNIIRPNTPGSPEPMDEWWLRPVKQTKRAVTDGEATLTLNNSDYGYISVSINSTILLLDEYLIEPGDSIDITFKRTGNISNFDYWASINNYDFIVRGRGSEKYKVRYELDKHNDKYFYHPKSYLLGSDSSWNKVDKLLNSRIAYLTPTAFKILRKDFYAQYEIGQIRDISYSSEQKQIDSSQWYLIENYLHDLKEDILDTEINKLCRLYPFYILFKSMAEYQLDHAGTLNLDSVYYYLVYKYRDHLSVRDKLLSLFLINYSDGLSDSDDIITNAMTNVLSRPWTEVMKKMYDYSGKGSTAYNFHLPDASNKIVRLSDFKGKVVFIDFWYTGCGACYSYYKDELSQVEKELENSKEFVFISISIDKDRVRWINSIKSGRYTSQDVINLYTEGMGVDHDLIKHYMIRVYPHPMIIDKNGKMFKFQGEGLRKKESLIKLLYQALNQV